MLNLNIRIIISESMRKYLKISVHYAVAIEVLFFLCLIKQRVKTLHRNVPTILSSITLTHGEMMRLYIQKVL